MKKTGGEKGKDWLLLKKTFLSQRDDLLLTFREIRRESQLLNELLLYLPFLTAVIFFVYTNRISHFYHNFGNYGFEENFLSSIQPVVKDLLSGSLRSLSLGLEGPVYPVLLALAGKIAGGDILKNALFLNTLLGTLSLFLSYYCLRRVFGTATAAGTLLLMATNAVYFEFTYTACSAPVFLFFTIASVYGMVAYAGTRGRRRFFILVLSGACAAFSALTLMTGIVLFAFFLIALFGFRLHGDKDGRPALSAVVFCLTFLAVFLVSVLIVMKAGAGFFQPLPLNEAGAGNVLLTHLKNLYFRLFMDVSELIGWAVGVFVLLGILLAALSGNTRPQVAFYSLGLMFFVSLAVLKYSRFYSFILLLFYLPLAVNIFGSGAYKKVIESRVAYLFLLLFVVLALLTVFRNLDRISAMARGEPKHLIDIANYIVQNTARKSVVLCERPLLPQRTGRRHAAFPDSVADFPALLKYAVEKKADYLLADYPEYNSHPLLRFLADPAMKQPLGLREEVRRDNTALFRLAGGDLSALEPPGSATQVPFYCMNYRRAASPGPRELVDFIRAHFYLKKASQFTPPLYQIVTQYDMNGCVLHGIIFRGPFGEVVTANLYVPPGNTPLKSGDGRFFPVLILPGGQPEGKSAWIARNFAENLCRNGCIVLVMDGPGSGERTGFGFSHSRALISDLACGLAPAHLFTAEALSARQLFKVFRNVNDSAVSVLALDEDCYTALYAAILDSSLANLAFVNGPMPFDNLLFRPDKPAQALIPGLAGLAAIEDCLRLLKGRYLQVVSLSVSDNAFASRLEKECGAIAFLAGDNNSFLNTNFEKSVRGLLAHAGAGPDSFMNVGLRAIPEQEKRAVLTIGPENLAAVSLSRLEVENDLRRLFRPDTLPVGIVRDRPLPADSREPEIQEIPSGAPLTVRRVIFNGSDPFGAWTEIAVRGLRRSVLIVPGLEYDSGLVAADTALLRRALEKGATVCLLPFYAGATGFAPQVREFFCHALYGLPLRALFENRVLSIGKYYQMAPDYLSRDALTAAAGLLCLDRDSAAINRFYFASFRAEAIDSPLDDLTAGYDGIALGSSHHYSPPALRSGIAYYAYGAKALDEYTDRLKAAAERSVFYFTKDDSLWKEQPLPENAACVFSPDSFFTGK